MTRCASTGTASFTIQAAEANVGITKWSNEKHKNCCILFRNGGWWGRGLEAVRGSQRVYLEAYTSLLLVPKEQLVSVRPRCSWKLVAPASDMQCTGMNNPRQSETSAHGGCLRGAGDILWEGNHHCR